LSLAANQQEAPPERRVKQTTVKKISWKAGVSLKRFIVNVLSIDCLDSFIIAANHGNPV
jgi:hypothetical protein